MDDNRNSDWLITVEDLPIDSSHRSGSDEGEQMIRETLGNIVRWHRTDIPLMSRRRWMDEYLQALQGGMTHDEALLIADQAVMMAGRAGLSETHS